MSHCRVVAGVAVLIALTALSFGCKDDGDTLIIGCTANQPPVVGAIPDQNATEGTLFSLDISPYVSDDSDAVADLTFI